MNTSKANPLVTALLCFASAAYVAGAPIVSIVMDSWTPMLIGLVLLLALVFVIFGVGTLAEGREDRDLRRREAELAAKVRPASDEELHTALSKWEQDGR